MAKVLRGDTETSDSHSGASPQSWLQAQRENQKKIPRKVIKAEEAQFHTGKGPADHVHGEESELRVKPIKNASIVEGVEVICRCGEKLIIRFNMDDDETNN